MIPTLAITIPIKNYPIRVPPKLHIIARCLAFAVTQWRLLMPLSSRFTSENFMAVVLLP
jgi:hypothetical protein